MLLPPTDTNLQGYKHVAVGKEISRGRDDLGDVVLLS